MEFKNIHRNTEMCDTQQGKTYNAGDPIKMTRLGKKHADVIRTEERNQLITMDQELTQILEYAGEDIDTFITLLYIPPKFK